MPEGKFYNPATDFLSPPEVVLVTSRQVACDGGGGALGHPKVYYTIGDEDFVDCGYCDRRFAIKGSKADPSVG